VLHNTDVEEASWNVGREWLRAGRVHFASLRDLSRTNDCQRSSTQHSRPGDLIDHHARIASLILLVLLHCALAVVLIRSMLDYVADDLSEFFMCHPGSPWLTRISGRQQEGRLQVRGLVFVHMHAHLSYAEMLLPYGQKRSLFPYGMADHATGFATVPEGLIAVRLSHLGDRKPSSAEAVEMKAQNDNNQRGHCRRPR